MSTSIEEKNWESLCHRCGKCCYEKHNLGFIVIADPEKPCKYLVNNSCSIYNERLEKNPSCKDIKSYGIIVNGALPQECGYVHLKKEYIPCVFPKNMDHFWKIVDIVALELVNADYEVLINGKLIEAKEVNFKALITMLREEHGE